MPFHSYGFITAVFMGSLLLYSSTLIHNSLHAHDSIYYINNIDSQKVLFHPHHLLYTPFAVVWIRIFRFLGSDISSRILVSLLSSVFGSLTLCVIFSIMRTRLRLQPLTAVVATALPAFSFGFWFYSGCVEVYMVPLFFLAMTLYLLTGDNPGRSGFAFAGLTHGLAVLFHQSNVLFLPAVIVSAFLNRNNKGSGFLKNLSSYGSVAVPVIAIPYLLVMIVGLHLGSISEMISWLTWYSHSFDYWYEPSLKTLLCAIRGFSRSLLGLHFMFAFEGTRSIIEPGNQPAWRVDEFYLVRNLYPGMPRILLSLSCIFLISVISVILSRLRCIKLIWKGNRNLILPTLTAFSAYAIFHFFFEPRNVEFWIIQSVCWWLLFTILWTAPEGSDEKRMNSKSVQGVLALLACLLLVVNFSGSIGLMHNRDNDYYYTKISPLIGVAGEDDLVITGRHWQMGGYVVRYVGSDTINLDDQLILAESDEEFLEKVIGRIEESLSRGGTVYISGEAVELEPDLRRLLGDGALLIDDLWTRYESRWELIENEKNDIYVLRRSAHTMQ